MVQFNPILTSGADAVSTLGGAEKQGALAGRVVRKKAGDDNAITGCSILCLALCAIGISLGMLMPAVYVTSLSNGAAIALLVIGSKLLVGGFFAYLSASSTCAGAICN